MKDVEEFYDKEFPDSKKRSKQEVIDFVDKYNKKSDRSTRVGKCLTGEWKETMVLKHEFDFKYNIKHINWKAILIIFSFMQIIAPLIVGLMYNDIIGHFKIFGIIMCFMFYPIIIGLIVFGRKEPHQTEEDYIENGEK